MVVHRVRTAVRVLSRVGQAGCALAVLAVVVGGPAAAQGAPPPPASVKFFIVPHAANPDDVTLFKIAQQALGDGNRFREIFQLNQGRARPDGTPFTDPAVIQPGQILELPKDAVSPGVQFGPLPPAPTPPSAPAPSQAQPVAQAAAPESGPSTELVASVTGLGGALTGLLIGLWWRRPPQVLPPSPFEPVEPSDDDDFEPVSGTLPIPVVLPRPAPDAQPDLWREPVTAEHSFVYLDTADTQVIAAIKPGSKFRFMIGAGESPGSADATPSNGVMLIVDDESDAP